MQAKQFKDPSGTLDLTRNLVKGHQGGWVVKEEEWRQW